MKATLFKTKWRGRDVTVRAWRYEQDERVPKPIELEKAFGTITDVEVREKPWGLDVWARPVGDVRFRRLACLPPGSWLIQDVDTEHFFVESHDALMEDYEEVI